jgi:FKBP-type peptidyl-prolyl cis-trans isomerase
MSDPKEEAPIVCRLCGGPIAKVKGTPEEAFKGELEQQLHNSCGEQHNEILRKHSVRQEDYTNALFQGMTQLLHLEGTEPVKSFYTRVEEATKEAHEAFPYMAAMAQQAMPKTQSQQPPKTIEVKRAHEGVDKKAKGKGKSKDGN